MERCEWYAETYLPTDLRARTHELLPDLASVRLLIQATRLAGEGGIVRVIAPDNVSKADLSALLELGNVRPT